MTDEEEDDEDHDDDDDGDDNDEDRMTRRGLAHCVIEMQCSDCIITTGHESSPPASPPHPPPASRKEPVRTNGIRTFPSDVWAFLPPATTILGRLEMQDLEND